MKTLNILAVAFTSLIFTESCNRRIEIDTNKATFLSYELNGSDTINFVDVNGKKQGHWIIFERVTDHTTYTKNIPCSLGHDPEKSITASSRTKFEEGDYRDDKKEGLWKYYNSDGSLKETMEFKNDAAVAKQ